MKKLACYICFEKYYILPKLNCGHTLCNKCLLRIGQKNKYIECPFCRQEVNVYNVELDYKQICDYLINEHPLTQHLVFKELTQFTLLGREKTKMNNIMANHLSLSPHPKKNLHNICEIISSCKNYYERIKFLIAYYYSNDNVRLLPYSSQLAKIKSPKILKDMYQILEDLGIRESVTARFEAIDRCIPNKVPFAGLSTLETMIELEGDYKMNLIQYNLYLNDGIHLNEKCGDDILKILAQCWISLLFCLEDKNGCKDAFNQFKIHNYIEGEIQETILKIKENNKLSIAEDGMWIVNQIREAGWNRNSFIFTADIRNKAAIYCWNTFDNIMAFLLKNYWKYGVTYLDEDKNTIGIRIGQ